MKNAVINLTPHQINLCDASGNIINSFPSFGTVRLEESTWEEQTPFKVPLVSKLYTGIEVDLKQRIPVAERYMIIVSESVLNALEQPNGFVLKVLACLGIPDDALVIFVAPESAVQDEEGRVVHVRRFWVKCGRLLRPLCVKSLKLGSGVVIAAISGC